LANDELLVITYSCLAEYHLSQGNVGQTKEYGQAALDLAQTIPSLKRMEAFAHLSLGKIEGFVGNWPAAIAHYQQTSQIWRKLDNHTYLARSLTDLGNIYSRANSFVLAQQAYEEAWGILKFTNNDKDKININLNLGTLFYRQEKWVDAEAAFLRVDPIALREQNEFYLLASFYNNLGNVYLKMQEWGKASEHLILASEIFRETNNQLDLGNSLGTLASVYEQDGQHRKALQAYGEAVSLLQKFPESQWAQELLEAFLPAYEELLAER
jgi:tetratricopeptide (TPR) repeat protein